MRKNGFISMSLVYAFFILFVSVMIAILVNYAHSRIVLRKLNKEIINELETGEVINQYYLQICDITAEYSSINDLGYLVLADTNITKSCDSATLSKAAVETVTDSNTQVAENGIYTTLDNDGVSFYYRGNITRNYVSFAGFIWRIVRVNGDQSIRIVLDGLTSTREVDNDSVCSSGCSGINTKFNTNYTTSSAPSSSLEAIAESHVDYIGSDIETSLNSFYDTYLTDYSDYIADAKFCNDKEWNGQTGASWYYSPYSRIVSNSSASLNCSSEGVLIKDYYNVLYALTESIGLLSADEVIYAGGKWDTANTSYFLYNNSFVNTYWWTMSPSMWYENGTSYAMYVDSTGFLYNYPVNYAFGVRPVINLMAGTEATGSGTLTDPYVIITD